MPTLLTQGAASARAYGFGASSAPPVYIEDVFSTYLYTGNNSTQTITNGIDLSGKGGLVWIKDRVTAYNHKLIDTARGIGTSSSGVLSSNLTAAAYNDVNSLTAFNLNGFSLGSNASYNSSSDTYASWTFRKQAKFFDVVTYTGNGVSGRTISHNLGSAPGCIIIKCTSVGYGWVVGHRGSGWGNSAALNSTDPFGPNSTTFANTAPTSTVFTVGNAGGVNDNTQTYVAYLFAHNAGGFGATGTDNVISCGELGIFDNTVNLGWEPQWILLKRADNLGEWYIFDTMRGITYTSNGATFLIANSNTVESTAGYITPITNGFIKNMSGSHIYIAIRRGPMRTPTTGTSVFSPVARAGTSSASSVTGLNFSPDSILVKNRAGSSDSVDWSFNFFDRLRFPGYRLSTAFTDAEDTTITFITSINMDGITFNSPGYTATNGLGYNYINYFFRRAPGFFDEVCYTGTGANRTVSHNLGVVPELMIVKGRSGALAWQVYSSGLANTEYLVLNTTAAKATGATRWNSTTPTSSVFSLGTSDFTNQVSTTYVAYLFATVAGVSKVGSYTGTGTTNQINCGFTGGARFVLIKRTDSTGDWYVWDSARGIVAGNDPYLLLNSTAAEVTNTDYVDIYSAGFEISSTAPAAINANGGTYIFLAIA